MKNFYQSYDAAVSPEERELVVKKALRQVIHIEQRKEWEQVLNHQHGITRIEKNQLLKISWMKLLTVAASFAAFIFAGHYFFNQQQTIQALAQEYLAEVPVHHPGLSKGVSEQDEQNRQIAISLFDSQKYAGAIDKFNVIVKLSVQDQFYLGLSYLYYGEIDSAIPLFVELDKQTIQYREEVNWFLSLAYILNNDQSKAKIQLEQIKNGDWNFQKSKSLLTKLN